MIRTFCQRPQRSRVVNLAFQIEIQADVAGNREIVSVECEPTDEEASPDPTIEAVAPGSWLFTFVLPDDFDGSESIFRRFRRYGVAPEIAYQACREATDAATA
jgi:hypothetical protein